MSRLLQYLGPDDLREELLTLKKNKDPRYEEAMRLYGPLLQERQDENDRQWKKAMEGARQEPEKPPVRKSINEFPVFHMSSIGKSAPRKEREPLLKTAPREAPDH
ncbi:hypothetical protein L596_023349 [Steinernema carpocapsae]|uniref:Uncharacterized protein n=1 Tax=Steinernema carpocapsae TaxID=34508 RepID=A0A4U5ME54_STECR|nr:hypothetical protein L596_023349 [Steinernema carpocapsae]